MNVELSPECHEAMMILKKGIDAAEAQRAAFEQAHEFAARHNLLAISYGDHSPDPIQRMQQFISDELLRSVK